MKKNQIPIFRGLSEHEIDEALSYLSAAERSYPKGAILLHAGEVTNRLGIVLSGSVTIESNDIWGTRTILNQVSQGHVFAETYAILPGQSLLVDVTANEDCRILFLEIGGILGNTCSGEARKQETNHREGSNTSTQIASPSWMEIFLRNLLLIFAQKNFHLASRNFHTAPRSVRQRIMSYLNAISIEQNTSTFDIPYNRQELADYLNLDRSALSKELGRMRDEGLILFRKNHFTLLQNA